MSWFQDLLLRRGLYLASANSAHDRSYLSSENLSLLVGGGGSRVHRVAKKTIGYRLAVRDVYSVPRQHAM